MSEKEEFDVMEKLSEQEKILANIHKCYAFEKEQEGWDLLNSNSSLCATLEHCCHLIESCELSDWPTIWYDTRVICLMLIEHETNDRKTLFLYYSPATNPDDVGTENTEIGTWWFRDLVGNRDLPPVYGKPNWNAKKEIIDCINSGIKGDYLRVIALEDKTLWHGIILQNLLEEIERRKKEGK